MCDNEKYYTEESEFMNKKENLQNQYGIGDN